MAGSASEDHSSYRVSVISANSLKDGDEISTHSLMTGLSHSSMNSRTSEVEPPKSRPDTPDAAEAETEEKRDSTAHSVDIPSDTSTLLSETPHHADPAGDDLR